MPGRIRPFLRAGSARPLLDRGDAVAELVLSRFEAAADLLDLGGAVGLDDRGDRVAEEQQDQRVGDGDAHQDGDDEAERELAELAEEREVGPVGGEQGAVDGEDDEGPDAGDRVDDPRVVGERGERIGAGDEGEGAGDQHGGAEGDVFPLLPVRAALEGFGAGAGEPEEQRV